MLVSAGNFKFIHDEGTGQLSVSFGGVECGAVARDHAITALMAKCHALEEFTYNVAEYQGDGTACLTTYRDIVADLGAQARELLEGV